ncbi:MAG: hypothetical protein M5U28_46570 [Sandaracinaceae bacterium]|nr:hypothetical protein [Sandaracinaceae bacterium]
MGARNAPVLFTADAPSPAYVPLVCTGGRGRVAPVSGESRFGRGSFVVFLVDTASLEAAQVALRARGWESVRVLSPEIRRVDAA